MVLEFVEEGCRALTLCFDFVMAMVPSFLAFIAETKATAVMTWQWQLTSHKVHLAMSWALPLVSRATMHIHTPTRTVWVCLKSNLKA